MIKIKINTVNIKDNYGCAGLGLYRRRIESDARVPNTKVKQKEENNNKTRELAMQRHNGKVGIIEEHNNDSRTGIKREKR